MSIIFLPQADNPYQELLRQALEKYGLAITYQSMFPSGHWLLAHRHQSIILHLHWPHTLYHAEKHITRFLRKLLFARMLGYHIVWTMHNLLPHNSSYSKGWTYLSRLVLVACSQAIIVHCNYAKHALWKTFYRNNQVYVIPHGSYCHYYPSTSSRAEARQQFRIHPAHCVYLYVGRIRPYKGIETLIQTFLQLAQPDTHLLIAGECTDEQFRQKLQDFVRPYTQITLIPEGIPDAKIQPLFAAADVFVAAFSNILTSGSIILALSFGLPVIAPNMGCLTELISPQIGILYPPEQPDGLLCALNTIRTRNLKEMGRLGLELMQSEEFSWENIAAKTWQVYQQLLT